MSLGYRMGGCDLSVELAYTLDLNSKSIRAQAEGREGEDNAVLLSSARDVARKGKCGVEVI